MSQLESTHENDTVIVQTTGMEDGTVVKLSLTPEQARSLGNSLHFHADHAERFRLNNG
jgi:hypothetical protein